MPSSKLMLSYNIPPERQDVYLRFMLSQFIPALQNIGLMNIGVWHTAYGNYPIRLIVFVAEDESTLERAMESDIWKKMEGELQPLVTDYARRLAPYEAGFQF